MNLTRTNKNELGLKIELGLKVYYTAGILNIDEKEHINGFVSFIDET